MYRIFRYHGVTPYSILVQGLLVKFHFYIKLLDI